MQIYDLIISKVSINYLNFGRKLGLSTDKLLRIEKNSRCKAETCETITYRILIEAEEEQNHNTLDMIIEALKAIGRKDIAREVITLISCMPTKCS